MTASSPSVIPSSGDPGILSSRDPGRAWRRFVLTLAGTLVGLLAALYGLVLLADPFGLRVGPGRPPGALMDLNQRWMYPQLARSRLYDGAVLGTSTMRLLDPRALGDAFEARVANLGMNAATPWEQAELARLYLRENPAPRLLVWGLDRNWCEPDADAPGKRLTFRSFPRALYGTHLWRILPDLLNLKSVEIAFRSLLHRAGLMRERIRRDGYEVFTPPEATYDVARARAHIWAGTPGRVTPVDPPAALSPEEAARLRMPALEWLTALVAQVPVSTRLVLVLPPINVAAQAVPGSRDAALDAACKARIAATGAAHGAPVVDFRYPSPLTSDDANYWDPLHYRLGVAARIVADLKRAVDTRQDAADGSYRVLNGGS